jgi:hypothetical protein
MNHAPRARPTLRRIAILSVSIFAVVFGRVTDAGAQSKVERGR